MSGASVRRAWRDAGWGEFWLQVRTRAPYATIVDVLGEATEAHDRVGGPITQLETRTPVGVVTSVDGVESEEQLQEWLQDLALRLEARGVTGTLQGVTATYYPRWLEPAAVTQHPGPTLFVAWSDDRYAMATDPERATGWYLPAEDTIRICDLLARWVEPGGPDIYLSRGTFTFRVTDGSTVADVLRSSVTADGQTSVLRLLDAQQTGRYADLGAGGECALQTLDHNQPWTIRVDEARTAAVALPDLVDQAFIRPALPIAPGWTLIDLPLPLPHSDVSRTDVHYAKHLLHEYVVDAHGIQVLRDAHLQKAGDLSRWTVTDLGHGRHLVEARDLGAWYADEVPDPDVLAAARKDFAGMLLTKQVIAEHPEPRP